MAHLTKGLAERIIRAMNTDINALRMSSFHSEYDKEDACSLLEPSGMKVSQLPHWMRFRDEEGLPQTLPKSKRHEFMCHSSACLCGTAMFLTPAVQKLLFDCGEMLGLSLIGVVIDGKFMDEDTFGEWLFGSDQLSLTRSGNWDSDTNQVYNGFGNREQIAAGIIALTDYCTEHLAFTPAVPRAVRTRFNKALKKLGSV